jgi:hypothetical protein
MASDITRTKYNIRKDPFTEADESILIEHELFPIPAVSPFYIELEEIPREESPSTVFVYLTDYLDEDVDISEEQIDIGHGATWDWWEEGDVILVDNEQMLINGIAGDTLSVTRAYGGTSAATHTNGTRFKRLAPWTEVYTAPSKGEYQVHYGTAAIPYRKGLIRFHEDDGNKGVWVDYYGTGHGNMAEHLNDIQTELAVIDANGWVTPARLELYTAGDYILASADTERSTTLESYTKVKEILIVRAGTLRIKFDLKGGNAAVTAYGRVYRNGVAVGTIQTQDSTSYSTKSEDIAGWSPGDLCQLYIRVKTGYGTYFTTYARNFRIYTGKYVEHSVIQD